MTTDPIPATHSSSRTSFDSVRTLTFEWAAVNLALQAPYDTVQLRAVLHNGTDTVISDGNTVHYTTPDTAAISVSATGLVTARQPIPLAHVIASITQGGRTWTDTARIQVTEAPFPYPLKALSIQPQSGGLTSARGNLNKNLGPTPETIPFFATVAKPHVDPHLAAARICSARGCKYPMLVHFTSSDPSIAYVDDDAGFHPLRPGRVTFTVSTIAYGVRQKDSLLFSVGYTRRTTTEIYTEQGVIAARLEAIYSDSPPYSVGLQVWVTNSTTEPVEVILPKPAHGVHFFGGRGDSEQLPSSRDTITAINATVRFDSLGTYILQYRGLKSGTIAADTFTVLPYP